MKTILIICSMLWSNWLMAQEKYVLRGHIDGLQGSLMAYLSYPDVNGQKEIIDSTKILNGTFTFTGDVPSVRQARLSVTNKGRKIALISKNYPNETEIKLYLEKGEINLKGSAKLAGITVSGTKTNDDNEKLKALRKPLELELQQLKAQKGADSYINLDKEARRKIIDRMKRIPLDIDAINAEFMKENPNSFMALVILIEKINSGPKQDYKVLNGLFSPLSAELKAKATGKMIESFITGLGRTMLGEKVSFVSHDVNGKAVKLSDYAGKYVLVEFWASWCGPCRAEIPELKRVYQTYKDKNFTILSISTDKDKTAWLGALADEKMPWTQLSDLDQALSERYAIMAIPFNFLVDPNGNIVAKALRGKDIEKELIKYLEK